MTYTADDFRTAAIAVIQLDDPGKIFSEIARRLPGATDNEVSLVLCTALLYQGKRVGWIREAQARWEAWEAQIKAERRGRLRLVSPSASEQPPQPPQPTCPAFVPGDGSGPRYRECGAPVGAGGEHCPKHERAAALGSSA